MWQRRTGLSHFCMHTEKVIEIIHPVETGRDKLLQKMLSRELLARREPRKASHLKGNNIPKYLRKRHTDKQVQSLIAFWP